MVSANYNNFDSYNKLKLSIENKIYDVPGYCSVSSGISKDISIDKVKSINGGKLKDNGRNNSEISVSITGSIDDYYTFLKEIFPLLTKESNVLGLINSTINDFGITDGICNKISIDPIKGGTFSCELSFIEFINTPKEVKVISTKKVQNKPKISNEQYGMTLAVQDISKNPYLNGGDTRYYQTFTSANPAESSGYQKEYEYLIGQKSDTEYTFG